MNPVILAIETSVVCSVALQVGEQVFVRTDHVSNQHSRVLLSQIDEIFTEAAIESSRLDQILWGQGPGSFTGLRIGAAAVQGLAYALDKPVAVASSLAVQAFGYWQHAADVAGNCVVLMDARLGDVYMAQFAAGQRIAPDRLLPAVAAMTGLEDLAQGTIILGDAPKQVEVLRRWFERKTGLVVVDTIPSATALLAMYAGGNSEFRTVPVLECQPAYLRDATIWKKMK